ncbi:hypothetical protein MVEG_09908 [Podila verticillata NRRL 6337]|nr:hypothetical protein MVEG_09908 [Podila verticillata NRRL 6337]
MSNRQAPPSLRQQPTSRPSHSQYSPPPLSPPFQPSFSQHQPPHQSHQPHEPYQPYQQQQQQQQQQHHHHQQQGLFQYPPLVNNQQSQPQQQQSQRQGYTLTDQSYRHQPVQQQQPYQYQPQSQYQPSQYLQPYQPPYKPSQYQPQAHRTPRQQVPNQQNLLPPRNNNNSNNNSFVPLIPVRQQSANIPLVTSTTSSPSVNHPLEPTTKTETIENLQPPRGFGFDSTYNNNDRPHSVASISNLSTHSNEPLNPSKKTTPNRKYSRKGSRMNYNNKARPATQSRSITPQPWHPDYNRGGKNPLDLPEQKKRMGRIDDDSEGDDFNPQDDHGDDDRRKSYPESGKTRNKPRFFSRMRDRLRTKVPPDYKVTGTGRLAQFSNERLYLHWIRFGILQGGVAVMLLSYGIGIASYIGVGALVLALSTLIYCTTLYHLRHLYMITKRKDAIYFERWIPSLLTVGLFALYLANLILTIIYPKASRNPPPWTTYGSPFEGRGAV